MPVGWAIAGAAVVGAYSASKQSSAARDAADTQAQSASDASAVQKQMFDISRAQQQPYMQSGYGANAELSRLMGTAPSYSPMTPAPTQSLGVPYDSASGMSLTASGGFKQLIPGGTSGFTGAAAPTGAASSAPQDQRTMIDRVKYPYGSPLGIGTTVPVSSSVNAAAAPGISPSMSSQQGMPVNSMDMQQQISIGGTGLPTGYLTQTFGPDQFKAGIDPGYQFRLQQGSQGVLNSASAQSGSLSGPALKALMDYNQGAASQEYGASFDRFQTQQGNIYQRLMGLSGLGQNAAAGVGNQAVTTGGNIGSNIIGAGNASAAGQIGSANAWSGAANNASSLAMLYAMG